MARKPTNSVKDRTQRDAVGEGKSGYVYRARAADHRKPDEWMQFKLRIRASTVKQLQKAADKKKHSANNEAVERIERSFANEAQAARDSAILDLLVGGNDASSELLRKIASALARNPDLAGDKTKAKTMIETLYYAAYGREPDEEPRLGEEL